MTYLPPGNDTVEIGLKMLTVFTHNNSNQLSAGIFKLICTSAQSLSSLVDLLIKKQISLESTVINLHSITCSLGLR